MIASKTTDHLPIVAVMFSRTVAGIATRRQTAL
jgi:hypothetical protein